METIHGDDVHKVAQEVLKAEKGIFRLAPTWIPRSFIRPGGRLKLAPQDIYALGGSGAAFASAGSRPRCLSVAMARLRTRG